MQVYIMLCAAFISFGGSFSAAEVSKENYQTKESTVSAMLEMSMEGQDFTISAEEAKKLTVEVAVDEKHANIKFLNQLTKNNLLPQVNVDGKELAEINKGVEGSYPLTFSLMVGTNDLEKVVMVTVEKSTNASTGVIITAVAVIGVIIVALLVAKSKKAKNK